MALCSQAMSTLDPERRTSCNSLFSSPLEWLLLTRFPKDCATARTVCSERLLLTWPEGAEAKIVSGFAKDG